MFFLIICLQFDRMVCYYDIDLISIKQKMNFSRHAITEHLLKASFSRAASIAYGMIFASVFTSLVLFIYLFSPLKRLVS